MSTTGFGVTAIRFGAEMISNDKQFRLNTRSTT